MSMNNIECDSCLEPKFNTKCPPRMADGRAFTDYRPRCDLHSINTFAQQGIESYKQRMYMTNNAQDIMKQNMLDAFNNNTCIQNEPVDTVYPHSYSQECNRNTCNFAPVQSDGVGLVRK